MTSLDTNLLVRLIARDDAEQLARVDRLVQSGATLFVATSVVVETARVLDYGYNFTRSRIGESFATLAGLDNLVVEHPDRVAFAIAATNVGVDFVDAMHLASADRAGTLLTFDKAFAKRAPRTGSPVGVQLL